MSTSIQSLISPLVFSLFVASISVVAIGCGDDDNGGTTAGGGSFEIEGEIVGSKQGQASFIQTDSTLNLSLHDNETFSLSFLRIGDDTAIPPEGEYTIGSTGAADFNVVYTAYVDGDVTVSQDYGNWDDVSGILVIVDADETSATGVFVFEAWRYDTSLERIESSKIAVTSGEFSAHLGN